MELKVDSLSQKLNEIEVEKSEALKFLEKDTSKQLQDTDKEKMKKTLYVLVEQVDSCEKDLNQMRNDHQEKNVEMMELQKTITSFSQSFHQKENEAHQLNLSCEQLKLKLEHVSNQVQDKYNKVLENVFQDYLSDDYDFPSIKKELESLKKKLDKMGIVNLTAIDEFEQLNEKYEFLKTQHDDLTQSKKQLEKVITKIDTFCSERFHDMFEKVNLQFQKAFPILFGGGRAQLVLIENEQTQESGVDIMASPPGKKMVSLSLLSGGEKALTAVSLIFSISLVKPSPFCLLDEVDAPLDDINVLKFNELIQQMAKRSQIIIVTHNKYTMRINSRLFGVTQEEKGVSKIISVSFDQAEKIIEA